MSVEGYRSIGNGIKAQSGGIHMDVNPNQFHFDANGILHNDWYSKTTLNNIDMNQNQIVGLTNPTNAQDIVTQNYLNTAGFSNAINLNSHRITNVANAVNAQDALTLNTFHQGSFPSGINVHSSRIQNVDSTTLFPLDAVNRKYAFSLGGVNGQGILSGLTHYYAFEGNLIDSWGGTNLSGTSIGYSPGKIGQSLYLGGTSSSFVDAQNIFQVGTGDFSVSMWVYPTVTNTMQCLVSSSRSTGSRLYFDSGGYFGMIINNSITSSGTYSANQWHHVVFSRSSGTGYIYVNGSLVASGGASNSFGGSSFVIGAEDNTGTNSLNGRIDELGVWTRALTSNEVTFLYNGGTGVNFLRSFDWPSRVIPYHVSMLGYRIQNIPAVYVGTDAVSKSYVDSLAPESQLHTGLRGYWRLDGNYKDSVGTYNGTESGGSSLTFSSTAIMGQSLKFHGTSGDHVSLGAGAFNFGTSDFTWQLWVRYPSAPPTSSDDIYLQSGRLVSGNLSYWMHIGYNSTVFMVVNHSNNLTRKYFNSSFQKDKWYHLVLTRSGGTNYTLYVNGQKDSTVTLPSGDYTGSQSYMGHDGSNNGNEFLDEVGAWDRALTTSEIQYLYHTGNGTRDFISYDYAIPQNLDLCSHSIIQWNSSRSHIVSLNPDNVYRVNPAHTVGVMLVQTRSSTVLFLYNVSSSAGALQFVSQYGSDFFNFGTGKLNGTSGTSGDVNISSDDINHQVDIENYTGYTISVHILNIF